MRKIWVLVLLVGLVIFATAMSSIIAIYDSNNVTIKENNPLGVVIVSGNGDGTCVVNEINLWSEPISKYGKEEVKDVYITGKIPNGCQEKKLFYYDIRDLRTVNGRIWYKVGYGNAIGWITDSFVIQESQQ